MSSLKVSASAMSLASLRCISRASLGKANMKSSRISLQQTSGVPLSGLFARI